jgi:predicted nucleic acid-binding protein
LGPETEVIHLDANFLIGAAERRSAVQEPLRQWLDAGELFAASSIAWAEFLNGPVEADQVIEVENIIEERVEPFGKFEARIASMLFNATGRKRGLRADSLLAAAAISAGVPLATLNRKDFVAFVPLGLRLA